MATPAGLAMIDFIESSLQEDPFSHAPAQTDLSKHSRIMGLAESSSAWTNNTVTGTFAGASSVAKDAIQPLRSPSPDSGPEGEQFASGDEARTNATPSHTRL